MANANNGSFQSDQLPGIFNVLDDKDDAYIAELFPQLLDGSTAGNINMMDSSLNQAAPYAIRPDFVVRYCITHKTYSDAISPTTRLFVQQFAQTSNK